MSDYEIYFGNTLKFAFELISISASIYCMISSGGQTVFKSKRWKFEFKKFDSRLNRLILYDKYCSEHEILLVKT